MDYRMMCSLDELKAIQHPVRRGTKHIEAHHREQVERSGERESRRGERDSIFSRLGFGLSRD